MHQDLLGQKVERVGQALQEFQHREVFLEFLARKDHIWCQTPSPKDRISFLHSQEHKAELAEKDQSGLLALKGELENQGTLDKWGTSVQPVQEESLGCLVRMESQGHLENQGFKDILEIRVRLETRGYWVAPAEEVQQAGREEPGSREREATMENWESRGILELRVQVEQRVIQDQQDHKVLLDLEDLRV